MSSKAEDRLWVAMGQVDMQGITFARQHRIGPYYADFASLTHRIVVEVDGYEHHSTREAFLADRIRERRIQARGWRVIRFAASEVQHDSHAVVREIIELTIGSTS
jgi:very-short-patch-repair endonuclease